MLRAALQWVVAVKLVVVERSTARSQKKCSWCCGPVRWQDALPDDVAVVTGSCSVGRRALPPADVASPQCCLDYGSTADRREWVCRYCSGCRHGFVRGCSACQLVPPSR